MDSQYPGIRPCRGVLRGVVMSRAGSGIRAWMLQRLSAVYMTVFVFGMAFYVVMQSPADHASWRELFSQTWVQLSWSLMFVFLVVHAWVGVRDIIIDYIHSFAMRLVLYSLVIILLGMMLLWSLQVTLS